MTAKDFPQIEIRKAGESEFYFAFKLPGHGMFVSRFFKNISEVHAAIEDIKENTAENDNYVRKISSPKQVYFIFRVENRDPIGQSTTYNRVSVMEISIQFMEKHLPCAEVVDLTS